MDFCKRQIVHCEIALLNTTEIQPQKRNPRPQRSRCLRRRCRFIVWSGMKSISQTADKV